MGPGTSSGTVETSIKAQDQTPQNTLPVTQ